MTSVKAPEGFTFIYNFDGWPYFYKPLTKEHGVVISYRGKEYTDTPFFAANIATSCVQTDFDLDKCIDPTEFFYVEEVTSPVELEEFNFEERLNNLLVA
jgi:hypothetical protein